VVNLAGGWKGGTSVGETPVEVFDEMIAVNVKSCFVVSREALRRGARRIVNVSSFTAAQLAGMAGASAYNLAKAAVVALTKAIAEEGAKSGVRCNCVAPGMLQTEGSLVVPATAPAYIAPAAVVPNYSTLQGMPPRGQIIIIPKRLLNRPLKDFEARPAKVASAQ